MKHGARTLIAAAGFAAIANVALAQATPDTANLPQPHLQRARAEAFKDNSWKSPALIACYPDEGQPAQKIIADPGPSRAADNLYFLGTGIVSAWALDTSAGIILIDALDNPAEVDQYIIGGLKKLGLDPARIKAVIISHGHGDHFGGARYLQDKFGVRLYLSDLDYKLAEEWAARPAAGIQAPRRDIVVADGDSMTLGDTTVKMFITPGHTPGGLSMLIPVKDKGAVRTLAYFGGITSKNLSAEMHTAFERSAARFIGIAASAKADGYIANHPSYDDTAGKLAHMRQAPKGPNPFLVGTAATVRFLTIVRECNLNNTDIEQARRVPGR